MCSMIHFTIGKFEPKSSAKKPDTLLSPLGHHTPLPLMIAAIQSVYYMSKIFTYTGTSS